MTQHAIDCLPVGVSVPIREVLLHCCHNPSSDWSYKEYHLIGLCCLLFAKKISFALAFLLLMTLYCIIT